MEYIVTGCSNCPFSIVDIQTDYWVCNAIDSLEYTLRIMKEDGTVLDRMPIECPLHQGKITVQKAIEC